MSRAPEIPLAPEEKVADSPEQRFARARNVVKKLGMVAAGTVVACMAASPFVHRWIDSLGDKIDPMTGKLEEVGNKTGKLAENVETGVPELSNQLGGVKESIDSITTEPTTLPPEDTP